MTACSHSHFNSSSDRSSAFACRIMSHAPIDSLPFEVMVIVLSLLPVRDRIRASRTSRMFHEAASCTLSQEKEIPALGAVPDATLARLIGKMPSLRVLDFDLITPGALALIRAETLAQNCGRIVSFKSVHLKHLSLVSAFVRALPDRVHVQSIDLQLQDWQVHTPHLYEQMSDIFAKCGQLRVIRLENASYGLLHRHEVWRLIGSRITSLEISCPYISVMDVFLPGAALRRVASSFTQSDFNYLCERCPFLQVLEETTFFREQLPDHSAVLALQSDPASDSDLILDMRLLIRLKHIRSLTLTSLISPSSRLHLADFLTARGSQLQSLDLNLSNGPLEVLAAVFKHCTSLQRLTLFLSCKAGGPGVAELTDTVKKYAGTSAVNQVLIFRHEFRTISLSPV